jgi:hypothetical protein
VFQDIRILRYDYGSRRWYIYRRDARWVETGNVDAGHTPPRFDNLPFDTYYVDTGYVWWWNGLYGARWVDSQYVNLHDTGPGSSRYQDDDFVNCNLRSDVSYFSLNPADYGSFR